MKTKPRILIVLTLGVLGLMVFYVPGREAHPPEKKTLLKPYSPVQSDARQSTEPVSPIGSDSDVMAEAQPTRESEVSVAPADPDALVELKLANSELYFRAVQREQQLARGETVESPPSPLEREQAAQLRVGNRLVKYLEKKKNRN